VESTEKHVDDVSLEDAWEDLEKVLGDRLPSPVHPENRAWFAAEDFKQRYGMARGNARDMLSEFVGQGLIRQQTQRRGGHNVVCYQAIVAEEQK